MIGKTKQPLAPCHPARARELLRQKKAAVYRRYPFTIILVERETGETQPLELKLDPGSKTTGLAIVADFKCGKTVVWAAELQHRGQQIKAALESRRANRRNRRARKTRYRQPRFDNRTRPAGWLPPSLRSRVDNCFHWARRLQRVTPLAVIAVETVRFDMQLMQNPEISGLEYQQGELHGYEVREYLLEKYNRTCVYCDKKDVPLQVEHVHPRAAGGSNRVSNLAIACEACNQKKGKMDVRDFLAGKPEKLKQMFSGLKATLKGAAAGNATRYAIGDRLKTLGLPISFWSGGRTKFNRLQQDYPKNHWIDAACVGETGAMVQLPTGLHPITLEVGSHGSRQMCGVDKFGFPRTSAKAAKTVHGFKTGDIVRAIVPTGKKAGTHTGRVAVRSTGSFNIKTADQTVQGIHFRHCRHLHKADGHNYHYNLAPFLRDRG